MMAGEGSKAIHSFWKPDIHNCTSTVNYQKSHQFYPSQRVKHLISRDTVMTMIIITLIMMTMTQSMTLLGLGMKPLASFGCRRITEPSLKIILIPCWLLQKILHLNVVVSHGLLVLLHLLALVDQHLLHGLLSNSVDWPGCPGASCWGWWRWPAWGRLNSNSNSSPIMVLTVTVMNIVMAAPIQYTVQKNRSISIFMKMDFLVVFVAIFDPSICSK